MSSELKLKFKETQMAIFANQKFSFIVYAPLASILVFILSQVSTVLLALSETVSINRSKVQLSPISINSHSLNPINNLILLKMKKQISLDLPGKKLLVFVTLLFVGLISTTEIKAQSKPSATLGSNGVLQLPTNLPLAPAYVFTLSSFGFQNENQAVEFFNSKHYDSFFLRPTVSQNKAVLMLDTKSHPGWTVSQWNNLLNSQTTATPLLN